MSMTTDRLIAMKGTHSLYLLFISGFCSFSLGSSDFHLIDIPKNYTEAKNYCRTVYTDLATVHNSTEMYDLVSLVPSTTVRAWIGLETGDVWMWHWSCPDQKLDFLNWKAGQPKINHEDACAVMDQHGEWIETDCRTKRNFVCNGNNIISGLIFVTETKSWRDAQNHCRGLSSDLISIHSAEENEAVHYVSVSQNVWIGLFKDPWKWSDGSKSSFRHWKPGQPNYLKDQNCTTAIFKDQGKWNDLRCAGKRSFVCRGARKSIPTTTHQTSTVGTTVQLEANLTTFHSSMNSSQEVIITFHFNVASNHSNSTNATTNETTTANPLTTPNTTDLVSSTSSTELNNATTKMSTVTATLHSPTTTAQVTTDGVSTLTTLMGTSAQTTIESLTLKPTENSHSLITGNLILIQENMTWIEAMGYCRDHHIDLVHITTKDIQGKVAETAKKSTSPHVWLGLRYTCKFNFWFWTKSTTSCYQNWAPGQGSEEKYDCGVTGAIEATGRQQWVGLPETEKLNFICCTCTG